MKTYKTYYSAKIDGKELEIEEMENDIVLYEWRIGKIEEYGKKRYIRYRVPIKISKKE